jgi:8-oxo-dGTP diphosphatase
LAERGEPGRSLARGVGRLLALPPYWLATAWSGLVRARSRVLVEVVDGVVVRSRGEGTELALVVRPDVRGWELPGGHLAPGETLVEGLQREVFEETGLRIEVGERTGRYRRSGFFPHVQVVFLCAVVGGELRPGPESPKVGWWSVEALPRTLLPWCRGPIADALLHQPGAPAAERHEHNGVGRILETAGIDLRMRLSDDGAS